MKASSPEMETICPRSSSPCSGVLKFRLASNASANVASADSLDWVMGLLDTFREVDLGPRDRLGSVSYSKAFTRAMRTEVRGSVPPKDTFHSRKRGRSGQRAAGRLSPFPDLEKSFEPLARRAAGTYIGLPCRAGCFIADVNGAEGRNES